MTSVRTSGRINPSPTRAWGVGLADCGAWVLRIERGTWVLQILRDSRASCGFVRVSAVPRSLCASVPLCLCASV
ncbi:MAG: hypothetical protein FWG87_05935 [Defluviitaleaceae bacterium]|nr:hypothetical protein [Defluviitaleaceae bacterium]